METIFFHKTISYYHLISKNIDKWKLYFFKKLNVFNHLINKHGFILQKEIFKLG